ncbi:MAG: LysM peptidoglycan-binding domain-containing protein, partial [Roseiarcus sp.]
MSESAALNRTRVAARVALAGLLGLWLAGCSSDATRLSEPFTNPFAAAANDKAPTPSVNVGSNASPQADANFAAVAHPSPVAVAALPAPAPATTGAIAKPTTTQPITGFGDGWRAAGGSPIVVADGDTLDTISRRYGVPPSALLRVNGFTGASQVHGGVRLIVPVYDAATRTASADAQEAPAPKVSSKTKAANKVADARADAPSLKAKLVKDKQAKDKLVNEKPARDKHKPAEVAAAKPGPVARPSDAA